MSEFNEELENLIKSGDTSPEARKEKQRVPKGWEANVNYDDTGGFLTSVPRKASEATPDEEELFAEFNLDSNNWTITNLRRSKWQAFNGEWLEAFRATFAPKGIVRGDKDIEEMLARISKIKPTKTERSTGNHIFVVATGDTQIGKPDGDGTEGTVERIRTKNLEAVELLKQYRKTMPIGEVYLPWLGDCIEGFNSQGGRLQWRNELTLTQMVRVYRRMLEWQVTLFAPLVDKLIIPIVPGNHDEAVRTGDIMSTTYDDSWAIEGASAVQDALKHNPEAFGHVQFIFPRPDELTITCDIGGTITSMAHGHQFGSNPMKWWADQAHGMTPIGDATLLLGAHKHHLHVQHTGGGKTFMQVPAMDGGSNWFRHKRGENAPAGLMTFTINDGEWNNLTIL